MSTPSNNDPSLGLLRSLTAGALDPDYASVANRDHPASEPPDPHPLRTRAAAVALLVGAAVLLVGGAIGLSQTRTGVDDQRDSLRQRVSDEVALTDTKSAQVQTLRDELQELSATTLAKPGGTDLTRLEAVTGATGVVGPGVRVVLEDATEDPNDKGAVDPELGRVLDVDVQNVVNGLWAAGAEAVAVNGQRLTSLSAIRSAGEAILVNYRPLAPPYVIEGIGDPRSLEAQFVDGPAGRALKAAEAGYGLRVNISTQDRLTLPAAFTSLRSVTTPSPQEARP